MSLEIKHVLSSRNNVGVRRIHEKCVRNVTAADILRLYNVLCKPLGAPSHGEYAFSLGVGKSSSLGACPLIPDNLLRHAIYSDVVIIFHNIKDF
jgi:hypothetical protein